jgi:hypothetical protein
LQGFGGKVLEYPVTPRLHVQDLVRDALAAWRLADRLAADSEPGSDRHIAYLATAARMRDIYTLLTRGEAQGGELDSLRAVVAEASVSLAPSQETSNA